MPVQSESISHDHAHEVLFIALRIGSLHLSNRVVKSPQTTGFDDLARHELKSASKQGRLYDALRDADFVSRGL